MIVPYRAGYQDSRSPQGVTRAFQQFLYISGEAWRSKVDLRSDHDIAQLYHVRLIYDCRLNLFQLKVAASDDRDKNTMKQHI